MGFWVRCICDNCGLKESVGIGREGKDEYSIIHIEEDGDKARSEFTSFNDVVYYTDLDFGIVFIGTDKCNPDSYKLLCSECREAVRQVDKDLARTRQNMITDALKERLEGET